jgi:alpha-1,3-glucosyltransferase
MLASVLASLNGGRDRRRGTLPRWVLPAVGLFAVLVRVVVSTHPHSGQSKPPMFGDYEAQRHWMELTLHTPLYQWYTHTTLNDLQYWGLDYPPLTAFQSWVCGVWMRSVEPASVALTTSRGWESYRSKLAMRFTVIVSDLLFTLPAVHLFVRAFYGREKGGNGARNAWATALILLAPGPILIDHGHFQYNNWSLGLTTYAVAAILDGKHVCGSVLFTLSLCHKQMSLYHAPAFFAHLFGRCLRLVVYFL